MKDNTPINASAAGRLARSMMFVALMVTSSFTVAATQVTYYHNDLLGSPVAATDENAQQIWEEGYHPYGVRTRVQSESDDNDIWYTGKPEDRETGLSYLNARYYDPEAGRFLAMDPVGYVDGNVHSFGRYTYANNNPYLYKDPNGDVAETVWDAANVAMGLHSFHSNVSQGNFWAAGFDAVGVIVDGTATFIPFVPGGAGAGIKAIRAKESAGKLSKLAQWGKDKYRSGTTAVKESAERLGKSGEGCLQVLTMLCSLYGSGDTGMLKDKPDIDDGLNGKISQLEGRTVKKAPTVVKPRGERSRPVNTPGYNPHLKEREVKRYTQPQVGKRKVTW